MTRELTVREKKVEKVSDVLALAMNDIKATIPTFLTPERLTSVFISQVKKTPKLLECDPLSLVKAFAEAGEIGLEPDGTNAHLIPYGKEVNYMVDYKGMIRLARMSGEIADMTANVVYSEDVFSHEYGSNKHLKHIKCLKKKRGVRMCAYSYVKYKDGSEDFRVLTEDEIMHAKKSSKTSAIWTADPDPMWAKTAVRQHFKFLPKVKHMDKAIAHIERTELADISDASVIGKIATESQDALKDKIKIQQDKLLPKADIENIDDTAEDSPIDESRPEETLAEGDFRSELLEYADNGKCEGNIPDALAEMGFGSLDEVVEQKLEDDFLIYFKENYPK
jgi:recombination protein RecT